MANYSVRGAVAIIQLDNAPVNLLSQKVQAGLVQCIKKAANDKHVAGIVVCGKYNNFSAGGDMDEFRPGKKGYPWITVIGDLIDKLRVIGDLIDKLKKPVVAAIEGVALGSGLEVALLCHYRIALATARVGFPEVQIGIIPGAGRTQRLPRAAGLKNALDIITTGNHVYAEKAKKMGIIDQVVSGDIVEEGIKFAMSKAKVDTSLACLRYRNVKVEGSLDEISEAAAAKVKSKYKGCIAPLYCVRAVINSARLPFEAGMAKEQEYFKDLLGSAQAAAQRYAFFAERVITRWQLPSGENYKTAKPLPVRSMGVIGAGTMGGGIALSLITSGLPCILVEQEQKFLDKGMVIIKTQLMGTVRLGKLTEHQALMYSRLLQPTIRMEDLANCDLVIEAVFEDLKLKREIFGRLDKICKPEAILCTNTSTLGIDLIASATTRPEKVVGTHFFAPAYIMKLLENIYGTKTSAETVATVMKLGKTIKKVPVLVGSCTGFVANRMLGPYTQEGKFMVEEGSWPQDIDHVLKDFGMPMGRFEVRDLSEAVNPIVKTRPMPSFFEIPPHVYIETPGQFMVEEGSWPQDIDQVLKDFGMPSGRFEATYLVEEGAESAEVDEALGNFGMLMGTFQVSDLSGIDIGYRIRREAARAVGEVLTTETKFFLGQRNCSLIERLVEKGRLGKKVGKGWYKYESPNSKTPYVDPEVTHIIEEHCRSLGIERRTIGSQEILERMQFAMINEGFKILEEGICTKPEEIDVIWIYGFSWPKYAGGPMYYASKIGLRRVYEKICQFHKQFPYSMHWVPSPLLARLSETDLPLQQWGEAARASKL